MAFFFTTIEIPLWVWLALLVLQVLSYYEMKKARNEGVR